MHIAFPPILAYPMPPSSPLTLRATTSEGDFMVNISIKAVSEYAKMLRLLQYDKVL